MILLNNVDLILEESYLVSTETRGYITVRTFGVNSVITLLVCRSQKLLLSSPFYFPLHPLNQVLSPLTLSHP